MTIAQPAQPATERSPRPVRYCAKCGELAGSRSQGTGRPLHREQDGSYYHVMCRPGAVGGIGTALAGLEIR
jgi:hypothetical protein